MTRARRIGCGSDRVADGGTPEVSESRGRGVANGEKPSGGARETRLKSRIDRSAGGRRGDDAAIGRQPARDIVDTADGVARDRPGDRESVAPRGQGGASGRHFFLCTLQRKSERTNPTPAPGRPSIDARPLAGLVCRNRPPGRIAGTWGALRHRRLRANARASFCRYPRPVRDFRCTKSPNQVFVWSDLTEHVPNVSPKAIPLTICSYDF